MPSDAFMELSDPAVWGETYDDAMGMGPQGRQKGAFEISSFDFAVSSNREDDEDDDNKDKKAGKSSKGKAAASATEPTIGTFTIKKYIDKASPDLFLSCLQKKEIDWAIITVREAGESKRKPYLVLEFKKVFVDSFTWALTPGDSGDDAGEETVGFAFTTMLIKYSRQEKSGLHPVVKIKGWNRHKHDSSVAELERHTQTLEQY